MKSAIKLFLLASLSLGHTVPKKPLCGDYKEKDLLFFTNGKTLLRQTNFVRFEKDGCSLVSYYSESKAFTDELSTFVSVAEPILDGKTCHIEMTQARGGKVFTQQFIWSHSEDITLPLNRNCLETLYPDLVEESQTLLDAAIKYLREESDDDDTA